MANESNNSDRARSFLYAHSSDDCWLDASSNFVQKELATLLNEAEARGRAEGRVLEHEQWTNTDVESGLPDD
jgi:hypothetical protein